MTTHYDCVVIGDWHLAFVTAGVLSSMPYKVLLLNPNEKKPWEQFPEIPVYEPGLKEIMDESKKVDRLRYSNSFGKEWSAKYVWMAIDTPVNDKDEADTSSLVEVAQKIKANHPEIKAFITNSQIPLGFSHFIEKEVGLPVVYIPENLRLGKGIETFLRADRTVIGSTSPQLASEIKDFMSGFPTQFLLCNLQTAEMIKHANNAFLATSISFANELARLGEKFEVDGQIVAQALKLDTRIGKAAYVAPGLGFAGGTLPRDVRSLLALGEKCSVPMRMMQSVMDINESTTEAVCEIITSSTKGISKPTVLVMGYTYKPDTDTLRRSLSLDIAQRLQEKGFQLFGYDPVMNSKDISAAKKYVTHLNELSQMTSQPDIVLIMTARPAFKVMDWAPLADKWCKTASKAPLVLDTQNSVDGKKLSAAGFKFKQLWSPQLAVGTEK